MASNHPSELDSYATDSVASSPRSDAQPNDVHTRVRFMCSFGGKIVPRPHDNQLRYVGGDTRIVTVHRATNFSGLLTKLSKLSGTSDVIIKYQLPSEDLDALISVSTDEDVENMMDEYDRLVQNQNPKSTRLRIFLFSNGDDSRTSSISSLLHGPANRDNWFIDALNSGGGGGAASGLERGRSEASSIVSEVPDYLFGLDNSDDPQARMEPKFKIRPVFQEVVPVSDPGSPAPVVSSPFCSTSSVPSVQSIPNLPPVKTKPDCPINPIVELKVSSAETGEPPILQPVGYPGNPLVHYVTDPRYSGQPVHPLPVYYFPSSVPPGNVPIQHVPIRAPYVQVQQYPVVAGQIPLGYHHPVPGVDHLYGGGGLRPATSLDPRDVSGARLVPDGVNQQVFYGVRNNQVSAYAGMVAPAATGEDLRGSGPDVKTVKVNLSS